MTSMIKCTHLLIDLIKMNIEKDFIVVKRDSYNGNLNIFSKLDTETECLNNITEDSKSKTDDDQSYYIINVNSLTFKKNYCKPLKYKHMLPSEYYDYYDY